MYLIFITESNLDLAFDVIDTLKQPSASVNPEIQASCNVIGTALLINIIVFSPNLLFKIFIQNDNCLILWEITKFPLNKWANKSIW